MPSLIDLQNSIAAAILEGGLSGLKRDFVAGAASAERRLRIFHNNTYESLTAALKATFPVTLQLADERFFAYAAHEFIREHPPEEARLSVYGGRLPRFLRRLPACKNFPIIAEMAAFEWAIAEALHAPDPPPVAPDVLAAIDTAKSEVMLALKPSLRFVVSRWSLTGVWAEHKARGGDACVPMQQGVHRFAVMRAGDDIQFLRLPEARFAFWRSLARPLTVSAAAERALARDRLFDLISETLLLFRMGLIAGVTAIPQPQTPGGTP